MAAGAKARAKAQRGGGSGGEGEGKGALRQRRAKAMADAGGGRRAKRRGCEKERYEGAKIIVATVSSISDLVEFGQRVP